MKQLRRSLNAISKNLKELTKRTDKLVKTLDKFEKAQAKAGKTKKRVAKRAGVKRAAVTKRTAVKKPARRKVTSKKGKRSISATETVLKIVNRSRKGIDTASIQNKTGYNTRKIWDIVHRAYKEGKISKVGRGRYAKA